jgi:hypothetical protein
VNELGRLIVEFSAEMLQGWQSLPSASVGVKSDQTAGILYQMTVSDADPDLTVTITAEQVAAHPTQCVASVDVEIPSRGGWPNLAGSEIVLRQGDRILGIQQTDAFGTTMFEDLNLDDLPRLSFEIIPIR